MSNQAQRNRFKKGELVLVIWKQANVIRTVEGRIKQCHRQVADVEFLEGSRKGAVVPIRYKELKKIDKSRSMTNAPEVTHTMEEGIRKAMTQQNTTPEPAKTETKPTPEPKKRERQSAKGQGDHYVRLGKEILIQRTGAVITKANSKKRGGEEVDLYAYVLIDMEDDKGLHFRGVARRKAGKWEPAAHMKAADPTNNTFVLAVASLDDPLLAKDIRELLEEGYLKLADKASKRKKARKQAKKQKAAKDLAEKLVNLDDDKLDKLIKLLDD